MTLRMADAIIPANLPPGMDAYAGYDDGNWPDFQTIAFQHPRAYLLDLTVYLANRGEGIDDEQGDASDADTIPYVAERHDAGVTRPVIYASISRMKNIIALQTFAGHPRNSYRLLSAHYGFGAHICGPTSCDYFGKGSTPQMDGTQWIDHGGWDESQLADDFFGGIVQPQYDPPVNDIVASMDCPTGGAWGVESNGAINAFGSAPYLGGANGQSYFVNRKAARLVSPNDQEKARGVQYVILDTVEERYAYPN